ncbi:MAG: UvrD-helicase domain-containing protein [Thermodesulfovibrionales bacterium]|nr:UvrD-helicase domain-containing protein [Thermodesulfovibrionales bacterium]
MSKEEILLKDLNPQQRDAVLHTGSPLLVLAGAGSGKTRVITHKFAYLAKSKKLSPSSILTVTFTNKASEEMKGRISHLLGKDTDISWIGTFHSQCNRILRREIKALGYNNNFVIYDDDDQSKLIRHILKEFKIYEALYRGVVSRISSLKSSLVSPGNFLSQTNGFGFDEKLAKVYVRYQDELKRCNVLDFDDLIMLSVKLFEENPALIEKYHDMFKYVLVDEFQDTNYAQYRLLKLLAAEDNICAVGDDDQSIYKFRGADIANILNFEKDFPGAAVIKLEQNYRSTQNILDVSGAVIASNAMRKPKKLWTERGQGEKVNHCWLNTEEEEAKHIASVIKELYLKGKYNYKDFAVLYRVNFQARAIEDALREELIQYRVMGGISFYQRKEIKDIIAYMRLVINSDDNVSLRRIINCPPRGIGAATLSKIEHEAKKKSLSLFNAIKAILKVNGVAVSAREKLNGFIHLVEKIVSADYSSAADMLEEIVDKTKYIDFIGEEKAQNIHELIAAAEGKDINEFSDSAALVTAMDSRNAENSVSLMTLHSTKGLEFPVVFVGGLEDGLLPYFKALDNKEELAEERRLFYVGMTRAKDILWLTGAKKRRLYNTKIQEQEPSRFLNDIPPHCCQWTEKSASPQPVAMPVKRIVKLSTPRLYMAGCRVKHPKWGSGVVRECYGDGDEQKVMVNFPNVGIKRLCLRFANLEKI